MPTTGFADAKTGTSQDSQNAQLRGHWANHCVRFGPCIAATPATLITGRLATPYSDGTCTRWIAPASPDAP
jgi:hypothetical protein